MKKILILLLFTYDFGFCENRQSQIDSLQIVLKTTKADTLRVNVLNELALQNYEQDNYTEAMRFATAGKSLATNLGYKTGIATSYKRIGAILTEQGNYPGALENLLQSLKLYESLQNKMGIFLVLNNIGTVYYYQSDYNKALEYYFEASRNCFNQGMTDLNIGMVYSQQGKYSPALTYFLKSLRYYESFNDLDNISLLVNSIGNIYDQENENDSASVYYTRALGLKKKIGDRRGICDAFGSIGDILFKQKKYKDALSYQDSCLILSKRIEYLNSVRQTEKVLSKIYSFLGDCKNSYLHYKEYVAVKDSMYNEENTKKTVSTEMNFEFEKKQELEKAEQDKKDAIQSEILKRQRNTKNAFIIGFIIVIGFSIFLFRLFKKNQKAKNIIEQQKGILEHKTKEITDSIAYAKNIQGAMLPSQEYLKNNLPENFIIYKPKDIVSGDFYWAYKDGDNTFLASADCTGHGVPGAMMSMLACSLLNEIVIERKITSPEMVLNTLRDEVIKALNPAGATQERKDGLDITFCCLNNGILRSAGANNPIYIVRNNALIKLESNRFPVGKFITNMPFTLNTIELQKGDTIYTLSDGFCDQFGEKTGKKLMSKKFKEWIVELSPLEMPQIKLELQARFENWVGSTEQVDDVTVFAVRV